MAKYFTDGSSTIGVKSAFCVTDENGKIVKFEETWMPCFTNNEEEYRGVIAALNLCAEGDEIYSDSMLVVNQVAGTWKINKPHLRLLREEAAKLLKDKKAKLIWIPREDNLAGKIFEK
jgi:ribonuclease HI